MALQASAVVEEDQVIDEETDDLNRVNSFRINLLIDWFKYRLLNPYRRSVVLLAVTVVAAVAAVVTEAVPAADPADTELVTAERLLLPSRRPTKPKRRRMPSTLPQLRRPSKRRRL